MGRVATGISSSKLATLCKTFCLLAAEANLSTLCMGGYSDGEVNRLLGLNPRDEGVVYSVAVGWPLHA